MIEEVREAVCGECVHCDACKNMMYSCSPKTVPGSVTMDFSEMPVGKCPHFERPAAFARKSVDGEIASLKMALDVDSAAQSLWFGLRRTTSLYIPKGTSFASQMEARA